MNGNRVGNPGARVDPETGEAASVLSRVARMYETATMTPCHATNPEGMFIDADRASEHLRCTLCGASGARACEDPAGSGENGTTACEDVLRYGILQAERFGGAYMSFCPNSLLITTAIVRREAQTVGALIAGPVTLVEKEELLLEELAKLPAAGEHCDPSLADTLSKVQTVDTVRAKALADMLEAASRDASAEIEGRVDPRIEASRRNARIAEYIQSLKASGYDSSGDGEGLAGYPFEKEKELVLLVERGDRAGSRRVLNEILGAVFFEGGGAIAGVRARAMELVALLSRAAVEGGATAQEVFGANEDFIRKTSQARTVEDIASWLAIVLNRFTDFVFTLKKAKHADMIRKAQRFMKEHYREELTLEQVAREVGLSTSYFSTVFKSEVGTGFAGYLNEIRIGKSKDLLRDRSVPIVEVAGMVGFMDQSYFSRVFKSIMGVSPGTFRSGKYSRETGIEIHGSKA